MKEIENAFQLALSLGTERDQAWEYIEALRKAGTQEVFDRSIELCSSDCANHRSLGVCVIAQFGVSTGLTEKSFHEQIESQLAKMVETESDSVVISSLISAISFQNMTQTLPWILALSKHSDADLRWRVAWALPLEVKPEHELYDEVIETLIRLSADEDSQVRDWATFTLGTQLDDASERVVEALLQRTKDRDFDTRSEAIMGLARRNEPRGLQPLTELLLSDHVGELAVEAAELYANTVLLIPLQKLKKWWNVDPQLVSQAIEACSNTKLNDGA